MIYILIYLLVGIAWSVLTLGQVFEDNKFEFDKFEFRLLMVAEILFYPLDWIDIVVSINKNNKGRK